MTRDLAIKVIKRMIKTGIAYDDGYAYEPLTNDEKEALDMAIKALKQKPCEDMERKIEKEYLFESLCEDLKKLQAENKNLRNALEQEPKTKSLGEELRSVRNGIKDENVLIGYNMAVAICNKYLSDKEEQGPQTGQKKNCNNCKYGYLSSTCEKPNAEICGNDFSQWVSYKAESEG